MRWLARILAVCLAMLGLQSCYTNISDDPNYDTGYVTGHIYRLAQDVNCIVYHDRIFRRSSSVLLLPPEDLARFVAVGDGEAASLPRGTKIVVTNVMISSDIENGRQMHVEAKFASGPYKGVYVFLKHISILKELANGGIFSSLQTRDPAYLEEELPNRSPERTPGAGSP